MSARQVPVNASSFSLIFFVIAWVVAIPAQAEMPVRSQQDSTTGIIAGDDQQPQTVVTRFYLVRHAEKVSEFGDPELSAAGKQRAKDLAERLKDAKIAAIYSTKTIRTRETGKPLAEALMQTVKEFDAPTPGEEAKPWAKKLIDEYAGKNVLVVAHSGSPNSRGSLPSLVSALADGQEVQRLGDEYFHLYIVTRKTVNGGLTETKIERQKYGKAPDGTLKK
ncbi:MAG: histidine phosphatase family protein [Pirellulales bacterium]|nr:histidine phosphatase family protein [Pirellulales bacterium]